MKVRIGDYNLLENIGNGEFGNVYKAESINDKKIYAIKNIPKNKISNKTLNELFITEIEIISRINHKNFIKFYEQIQTNNNYYLVMEYYNLGNLEEYLRINNLDEKKAINYLIQLINIFKELKDNNILYPRIKLSNLLLYNNELILGKLGLYKLDSLDMNYILERKITMAPELSNDSDNCSKAYLWLIGILFYKLLFNVYPFEKIEKDDIKNNSGKNLKFPDNNKISDECKELLKSLIEEDVNLRINWEDLLNHDLIKNELEKISENNNLRYNKEKFKELVIKSEVLSKELKIKINEFIEYNNNETEKINDSLKRIIELYNHEKKKNLFMIITSKKVLELSKLFESNKDIYNELITLNVLLMKKWMFYNFKILNSLELNENILNVEEEEIKIFFNHSYKKRLFKDLNEYSDIFTQFKDKLEKLFQNIDNLELKKLIENLPEFKYNEKEFNELNEIIIKFFKLIKEAIINSDIFSKEEEKITKILLSFYYCIKIDEKIIFEKNGEIFDWIKLKNIISEIKLIKDLNNIIEKDI